jgi:hypothetical protein
MSVHDASIVPDAAGLVARHCFVDLLPEGFGESDNSRK